MTRAVQTCVPYSEQELELIMPIARRAIGLYGEFADPYLNAIKGYSESCAVSCAKLAQDVRIAGEEVAQQIEEKIGLVEGVDLRIHLDLSPPKAIFTFPGSRREYSIDLERPNKFKLEHVVREPTIGRWLERDVRKITDIPVVIFV